MPEAARFLADPIGRSPRGQQPHSRTSIWAILTGSSPKRLHQVAHRVNGEPPGDADGREGRLVPYPATQPWLLGETEMV